MEETLGNEYKIIDEGLRARTLSGENGFYSSRNGLVQFGPILGSHLPLDLVCIMLGTNDCNSKDTKGEDEISQALEEYKKEMSVWCKNLSIEDIPQLMIIAPPLIRGDQVKMDETMSGIFGDNAEEKSKRLKVIYKDFCGKEVCIFFDASEYCKTADGEGIHLDEENNKLLGDALAEKIKDLI